MTAPTPPADPTPPTPPAPDPGGRHSAPADPADPAGATPTDGQLGDAGKKALDEERKARRAAEAELAKYRKAEQDKADAEKTELQKAADRAAAAEKIAAEATLKALKLEVAAEKGLNAKQAARLVGATREELEADADELLASFPTAPATPGKTAPKPDPSQGPKNPAPQRARSLTEAIKAHYATGTSGG